MNNSIKNTLKYMRENYLPMWYSNCSKPHKFLSIKESSLLKQYNLNERIVQAVWNEQQLNKDNLVTLCGKKVEIINPGSWNTEPGPDFKSGHIRLENIDYKGEIEIHLRPEMWRQHGHHWDPAYNKVILHVVWENPRNLQIPETIPVLSLKDHFKGSLEEFIDSIINQGGYTYGRKYSPFDCAEQLTKLEDANIQLIFQAAGLSRILQKSWAIHSDIIKFGLNQALYKAIFKALGYKNNSESMEALAATNPIDQLRPMEKDLRKAVIWGTSGLLPDHTKNAINKDLEDFVKKTWKDWWFMRSGEEKEVSWSGKPQRPQNSPERRVAAGIALMEKYDFDPVQVLTKLKQLIKEGNFKSKTLREMLEVDGLWENFYNFSSKSATPIKLIGDSRKMDILINTLIPALMAVTDENDSDIKQKIFHLLFNLPKLQMNIKIKQAGNRFFIPPGRIKQVIKGALQQQGLMQLMKDYENYSGDKREFWMELGLDIKEKSLLC